MSLTRNDIQILKEVFKPEFDKIHERFERIDKRFEQIDKRFEQNEVALEISFKQLLADLYDIYTPRDEFAGLEKRVTVIEKKLHTQSS